MAVDLIRYNGSRSNDKFNAAIYLMVVGLMK